MITLKIISLSVIVLLISCQNQRCYASCISNSCLASNALFCTGCSLGLVNINGSCISTDSQPAPIRYITPLQSNILNNDASSPVVCSINNQGNIISMAFNRILGSSFTRPFNILVYQDFIQVKFNLILFTTGSALFNYKIRVNQVVKINKSPPVPVISSVFNCQQNLTGNFPVFLVNEKFSSASSSSNILIQTSISSPDDSDTFGIVDVLIYYGSCAARCSKCFGSTNNQCQVCRGLYLNIANNTCSNCPTGFYDTLYSCIQCPPQCDTCNLTNGLIICITCNLNIAVSSTNCTLKDQTYSSLNLREFNDASGWKSSTVLGTPVTKCGLFSLVGGNIIGQSGSTLSNTFNGLSAHTSLWIKFTLFLIDQQPNSIYKYIVSVDSQEFQTNLTIQLPNATQSFTNECGDNNLIDFITKVYLPNITHSGDSAQISIKGFGSYFGMRDFILGVVNLTNVANCSLALNGVCVKCNFGLQLVNSACLNCPSGFYFQFGKCNICPIVCKTCILNETTSKLKCVTCQPPLSVSANDLGCADVDNQIYSTEIINNGKSIVSRWLSYPILPNNAITKCATNQIVGSSQIAYRKLKISRNFDNLPPHFGVQVHFHFYQIDDYPGANDNTTVYFYFNGQKINYNTLNYGSSLCGNSTLDTIQKVYLTSSNHSAATLSLQIYADQMVKFGLSDIILFLLNCPSCSNSILYTVEVLPYYSVYTPPNKGILVRYRFNQPITNSTDMDNVFIISINNTFPSSRLLQTVDTLKNLESKLDYNKLQYTTLRSLQQTHLNDYLITNIQNPSSILSIDNRRTSQLQAITTTVQMPRYDQISETDTDYRSNIRNLTNFFRGCAVFGMFIGMISFIFGMSSTFDDFFVMTQIIFVHIFIQGAYNPPTYKIPLSGMQLVQFMAWLPIEARQMIEGGIIPSNLNQYSPLIYCQFFPDLVYARTIYHTILFLIATIIFYIILVILSASKTPVEKQQNYFLLYYHTEQKKVFVFIEKVVRFVFFTFMWSSILQYSFFEGDPKPFYIWNSVLMITLFVIFGVYPIVGTYYLYDKTSHMIQSTYYRKYQGLRINYYRLWYFPIKYYYLLFVAAIIAPQYKNNPVASLVPLLVVHLAYGVLILVFKPFGMIRQPKINVYFYNNYHIIYQYTSAIQYFLLALLEILMLSLYGQRNASSSSYLAIGYGADVVIILLLINGLVRLFWGFMSQIEGCHQDRIENNLQKQKNNANVNMEDEQKIFITKGQINQKNTDLFKRNQSRRPSIAQRL